MKAIPEQEVPVCLQRLCQILGENYPLNSIQFLTSVMQSLPTKPWLVLTGSRHSLSLAKNLAEWMSPLPKKSLLEAWKLVNRYCIRAERRCSSSLYNLSQGEYRESSTRNLDHTFLFAEEQEQQASFAILKGLQTNDYSQGSLKCYADASLFPLFS